MMNPYDSGANGIAGILPFQPKQPIVVQNQGGVKGGMLPKLLLSAASMGIDAIAPGVGSAIGTVGNTAMGALGIGGSGGSVSPNAAGDLSQTWQQLNPNPFEGMLF